jgi:hypothetical protein
MLEAIELPTGRFAVQAIGSSEPYEAAGEFDSLVEAEEWIFEEAQRRQGLRDDSDIMRPGGSQGLR